MTKFPLKELRVKRLSQAQFAQITTDRLSIWECSYQSPRMELQIRLAKAFKMQFHTKPIVQICSEVDYIGTIES